MKAGFLVAIALCAAIGLTGCGLFGSDNSNSSSSANNYKGSLTVGLTDNVPASGGYVIQNIYNPAVRNIIAIVQIDNATKGTKVEGQWYQMHVFEAGATNRNTDLPAEGTLVTSAGFQLTDQDINDAKRGNGRVTLTPNAPLPEDSYELRIFVDGKLAKVQPFVVSKLVPGPAASSTQPAPAPPATPVRTATPSR
ncbi:MAG TPA: hypothetical protein VH951_02925 [Dehalococcoidia bacterium]|jgi:hypothetical protein